jgi:hypothetical protein
VTSADILRAIQSQLTVNVWPIAGKALGYRTKSAAYAAVKRGDIKVLADQGRRKPVPTLWLRKVLFVEEARAPGRGGRRRRESCLSKTPDRASGRGFVVSRLRRWLKPAAGRAAAHCDRSAAAR